MGDEEAPLVEWGGDGGWGPWPQEGPGEELSLLQHAMGSPCPAQVSCSLLLQALCHPASP